MVVPVCTHARASLVISPWVRKVWAAISWAVVEVEEDGSERSCWRLDRMDFLVVGDVEGESYWARRAIAWMPGWTFELLVYECGGGKLRYMVHG